MAEINLTGSVIYSNDGTVTALPAITVGDVTFNISGTGSTTDKFAATSMNKVVFYDTKLENVTFSTKELTGGNWAFIDTVVTGNDGTEIGASLLYMFGQSGYNALISGSTFSANNMKNAPDSRGLIANRGGTMTVDDALFTGNIMDAYGAIHQWGSASCTMNISGSTFTYNHSDVGAAISAQSAGWVNISGGAGSKAMLFHGNTATSGGAIWGGNYHGRFNVNGATFSKNIASSGGVAYNELILNINKAADGTKTLFSGNTAGNGGVIYTKFRAYNTSFGYPAVTVNDAVFEDNFATGNGGAVYSTQTDLDIRRNTFTGNIAPTGNGGAIWLNGDTHTMTFADNTFTANTGKSGGAVYISAGTVSFAGDEFSNNISTSYGGAAYINGMVTFTDVEFSANTGSRGGALILNSGSLRVTNCTFSGNTASGNKNYGGAIYTGNDGAANTIWVDGCQFLTHKDTFYSYADVRFSGDNVFNASFFMNTDKEKTAYAEKNATFTFNNDTSISFGVTNFLGNNTITFAGTAEVDMKSQTLTGVKVVVKLDAAEFSGARTIAKNFTAENFTLDTDLAVNKDGYISVDDEYYTVTVAGNELKLLKNGVKVTDSFTLAQAVASSYNYVGFGISEVALTEAITAKNNLMLVNDTVGPVVISGGANRFMTVAGNINVTLDSLTVKNFTPTGLAGGAIENYGKLTIKNGLFTGNSAINPGANFNGGAICNGSGATLNVTGTTFSNNSICTNNAGYGGGAIYNAGTANITDGKFFSNSISKGDSDTCRGAAIHSQGTLNVYGGTFSGNIASNDAHGAIYGNESTINIYGNTVDGKVTNALFDSNSCGAVYSNVGVVNVNDATFINNSNYAAVRVVGSSKLGELHIDGATFYNNTAHAVYITNVTATISDSKFLTAEDIIYLKHADANLTFSGKIDLNASLSVESGSVSVTDADFVFGNTTAISLGSMSFNDKLSTMKFDGTAEVNFINQSLSDVALTVNGALYQGEAVTIATGVSAIGDFTITDKADPYLTLEVVNGNLLLKEIEAQISGEEVKSSYTGDGVTVMDGGAVGTFFATKDNGSEIATKISGGKVESNLVGGAYVAAGNTAEVDKVELLIGGTAEVAAKVYAGGYLYGNAGDAEAAAEAQLKVTEVNISIDGGAVSTNMYGGAHARDKGKAEVTTVNITITKGNHSRIYAGGWAEKGAESHVGISNVIISGGTVDYLYGAGANADGKTYVTTTNITVSDAAVVNTIFMGGRYGYSWVDNVNLTFAGAEKVLKRLSGVSSAGMDYADATVVELKTNVTANLIDYVDKFVINEGCMLTAVNEFYLGDRNNETGATEDFTTFDFIAEGEANWTAVAGISDFTNAKFAVNGSEAQLWDGKSAIAIDGYSLTYNAEDKTIKLAQITA
ncbi:MAG: hypothetical protein E7041_01665 [Lentisphaerae bacterium]|nr:hypothetical protein [Lentisphaerota bacterium]